MTNKAATLPPNPFEFTPIKDRKKLAGREADLAKIGKYLDSTASGSCPHIGLIGGRGVGKTSMLNAIEELAVERELLCLRIDLDENKASSPGKLWHEIYAELLEKTKSAGCWKGEGKNKFATYFALRKLLAGNSDVDQERIVLMFPYDLANTTGGLTEVECSSTTIKKDFEETLAELKRCNLDGIVLIIDEADCLGPSQTTLQQLRNLFQSSTLRGTSLVLAGTENIFSNIEEVFSPIPRQFHRIDVKPFKDPFATRKLIIEHLYPCDQLGLLPPRDESNELHEITGGDPHEIQLYCHWMYQEVEKGNAKEMRLLPSVFKGVMNEFVKNAAADTEAKNAIELIDNLRDVQLALWLRYRSLSLDDIIHITKFTAALASDLRVRKKQNDDVEFAIRLQYKFLHDTGLLTNSDQIVLVGGPLTSAYYKAVFNLKNKGKTKFTWSDENVTEVECNAICSFLDNDTKVTRGIKSLDTADEPDFNLLLKLRDGNLTKADSGKYSGCPVFDCSLRGKEIGVKESCCIQLIISKGQHERLIELNYVNKGGYNGSQAKVEKWIKKNQSFLDANSITVEIVDCKVWTLASDEEIWRIDHILNVFPIKESQIHPVFGKGMVSRAIDKYFSGDCDGASDIFRMLINDADDNEVVRNNLAFVLSEQGKHEEAIENLERSLEIEYTTIAQHNLALFNVLIGKKEEAIELFKQVLDRVESSEEHFSAHVMKVLSSDLKKSVDVEELPTDAAAVINCCVLGIKTREDAEAYLKEKYPDDYEEWLSHLPS